jgi:hypothetical protein
MFYLPLALTACSIGRDVGGSLADDISFLRPGLHRAEVEERLGRPQASGSTESGEIEMHYTYSRGLKPADGAQAISNSLVYGFDTFVTLGGFAVLAELADCTDLYMLGAIHVTYEPNTQTISRVCKSSFRRESDCFTSDTRMRRRQRAEVNGRIPPANDNLPTCT